MSTPVPANRQPRNLARTALLVWTALMFLFLFLPIFVIVIYSFNGGRNLYVWTEWSAHWYAEALGNSRAIGALWVSLQTALANAVIAVVLGTLLAGEPWSPRLAVAGAAVLIGMALVKQ